MATLIGLPCMTFVVLVIVVFMVLAIAGRRERRSTEQAGGRSSEGRLIAAHVVDALVTLLLLLTGLFPATFVSAGINYLSQPQHGGRTSYLTLALSAVVLLAPLLVAISYPLLAARVFGTTLGRLILRVRTEPLDVQADSPESDGEDPAPTV